MSYKLTLTKAERDAIDWVGRDKKGRTLQKIRPEMPMRFATQFYRYSNGNELRNLLEESKTNFKDEYMENVDGVEVWDLDCDLTFDVPEDLAWSISENAKEEDGDGVYTFPCFSEELSSKLVKFCEEII